MKNFVLIKGFLPIWQFYKTNTGKQHILRSYKVFKLFLTKVLIIPEFALFGINYTKKTVKRETPRLARTFLNENKKFKKLNFYFSKIKTKNYNKETE